MNPNPDRLYELMPVIYRLKDAQQSYALRALLRVVAEQVNLIEDDISQLYENWFIETCQDWVVPYIGNLVGYTPLPDASNANAPRGARGQLQERLLIPRAEVENTIRYRRRKGTLSVLEDLARAVGGWPAHAVEFFRLLAVTQNINYRHLARGRTVDVRDGDALDELAGPFGELAHSVDVRRVDSHRTLGTFNIPEVGVYVWRLKSYSVTLAPAYCFEEESPNCYLFSVLGNDTPLYVNPSPINAPFDADLDELEYPGPIRRRRLQSIEPNERSERAVSGVPFFYGDGRSFQIWVGSPRRAIAAERVIPADLSDWKYRPLPNTVAVDPERGRIVFPPGQSRNQGVWVTYHYAMSADIGGGEYPRPLQKPASATIYLVGEEEVFVRIGDALARWQADAPQHAVIEITDSGAYVEPINITLRAKQTLQIRASKGRRPVIRLLDWQTSQLDDLAVTGESGSWFTLDGLLVTGRGIHIEGNLAGLVIRHSTLVPGWGMHCDCEPKHPTEPSLEIVNSRACVAIEHSIVGGIQVNCDETTQDPVLIRVTDSIIDATAPDRIALGAPQSLCAFAVLTVTRTTIIGQIQTHSIELAENSIFIGTVLACRRQRGCMRFCYVPPDSRTPQRFECQPDGVDRAVANQYAAGAITASERDRLRKSERLRVEPEFNSARYGMPTYCQLSSTCADEITSSADDGSEMGAFHDLYQPQRAANLRTRLDEFSPAATDTSIIFAS